MVELHDAGWSYQRLAREFKICSRSNVRRMVTEERERIQQAALAAQLGEISEAAQAHSGGIVSALRVGAAPVQTNIPSDLARTLLA